MALGSEVLCVRTLQGALLLPGHRASLTLLHREEVARQHRGATAGAEVHRCLGSFGGLQREREVLCAWSGDAVPVGHISFLGIGSSSSVMDQPQPVSQVVCTSTYNYCSYSEYS